MDQRINIELRDYLDGQHQVLVDKLNRIEAKQDYTNGRLQKAEIAIAVLQWAYALGVAVVGWVIYKTV